MLSFPVMRVVVSRRTAVGGMAAYEVDWAERDVDEGLWTVVAEDVEGAVICCWRRGRAVLRGLNGFCGESRRCLKPAGARAGSHMYMRIWKATCDCRGVMAGVATREE